ncbi:MAG: hypothetical protein JKY55_06170 [Aliivibrio sp.]|uniref:DUF5718 family protein n=1 Tax=Aliivibrio sp. TaxID=1872443 RepID=UPI001A59497A|nr:hypothetical protein [Aliivibrio sp.]
MFPLENHLSNTIAFGVAGNFAGHLEQAGEANDFLQIEVAEESQPKAIFPIYVPNNDTFLSTYPLSYDAITPPNDADNLQIEPEVALVCNLVYKDGEVVDIVPKSFSAFNDCSIRKPSAIKISEKKNWGAKSKGISRQQIAISDLNEGGFIDRFHIASFHIRDNKVNAYGLDSPVTEYNYFHQKFLDWVKDRINNQKDIGPTENIAELIKTADYPSNVIISVGATRYTEFGETTFLKSGDTSIVMLYNSEFYSASDISDLVTSGKILSDEFAAENMSLLIQHVE